MNAVRIAAIVGVLLATGSGTQAVTIAVLPSAMIGTWGWDAGSCAKPDDDGHATVRERSVDFAASSYELETIGENAGTIRATATVHEEGEPETSAGTLQLKLVAPDQLSVSNGPDLTHTYVRCAG